MKWENWGQLLLTMGGIEVFWTKLYCIFNYQDTFFCSCRSRQNIFPEKQFSHGQNNRQYCDTTSSFDLSNRFIFFQDLFIAFCWSDDVACVLHHKNGYELACFPESVKTKMIWYYAANDRVITFQQIAILWDIKILITSDSQLPQQKHGIVFGKWTKLQPLKLACMDE